MSVGADPAGVVRLRPGQRRPRALATTRRALGPALARGRDAALLPDLLGHVFALCGHAHRLCATLAIGAARGCGEATAGADALRVLRAQTLRDHAREVCLHWPAALRSGAVDAGTASLCAGAAALGAADRDDVGAHAWLSTLLGCRAALWLRGWERDPQAWMRAWLAAAPGWLADMLAQAGPVLSMALPPVEPLRVHADPAALADLGAALRDDAGFCLAPTWRERCAETGCWVRLRPGGTPLAATPLMRCGARLAEMAALVSPAAGGGGALGAGALVLGPCEGLAWVEMARGLLVHRVRLEARRADARVEALDLLAPTEWNFHPHGAAARAVEALDPAVPRATLEARAAAAMLAYDPCVRYELEALPLRGEALHA